MIIYIKNHDFHYETENLTRVFFPNEKIEVISDVTDILTPPYIFTEFDSGENIQITAKIRIGEYSDTRKAEFSNNENDLELELALLIYDLLVKYTGITPPWGVLTGVRPIKLFRRLSQDTTVEEAADYFRSRLMVSDEKTKLAIETEKHEQAIIDLSEDKSYSLYISIPFCPSRCSYCSFVSASVERAKHLIEPYTELLCKELEETAKYAKELGLRLESVYMGGGTPTTLSADQMKRVLTAVNNNFDLSSCREFTVEAGRPDTITEEKLNVIKECGADRISINPQTLNDDVLRAIGRRHTAQQTIDTFVLARRCGFDHINMDLIAGLPTDTEESFIDTLDRITDLDPESITIHTLAMKRASTLTQDGKTLNKEEAQAVAKMLSYANKKLHFCGYIPYYLYRQSRMAGNMENTGWSKPGKEGIYNVFVMDETHTVLACGAGAVTKLKENKNNTLERIFNFKYPYEYIDRFSELTERKKRIGTFYAEHY